MSRISTLAEPAGWGALVGASPQLLRIAEAVNDLGLDRDQSIDS
jgi:hypothetical protein